ncbi:hypothetical protein GCM10011583_09960 [Streptomyces camponoticapitis]|uniref:Uncharacterized protein n=1 Tax=Streptomyces camponoticapitis TaxID=1616125 RepID=A0ABQ2E1P4_9ACTN|nr:hypothetical protein GCM10011583_09960 [Streptomyces camponoticapitis]
MTEQGGGAEPGPREVRAPGPLSWAASVVHPYVDALVDVHGRGLGDDQPAVRQQSGRAAEQTGRVAADADVAVDEQDGAPTPLAGKGIEDGAAQGGTAVAQRTFDGRRADVDAERPLTAGRERGDETAGAAADVQDGALATVQGGEVGGVGA